VLQVLGSRLRLARGTDRKRGEYTEQGVGMERGGDGLRTYIYTLLMFEVIEQILNVFFQVILEKIVNNKLICF